MRVAEVVAAACAGLEAAHPTSLEEDERLLEQQQQQQPQQPQPPQQQQQQQQQQQASLGQATEAATPDAAATLLSLRASRKRLLFRDPRPPRLSCHSLNDERTSMQAPASRPARLDAAARGGAEWRAGSDARAAAPAAPLPAPRGAPSWCARGVGEPGREPGVRLACHHAHAVVCCGALGVKHRDHPLSCFKQRLAYSLSSARTEPVRGEPPAAALSSTSRGHADAPSSDTFAPCARDTHGHRTPKQSPPDEQTGLALSQCL